MPKLFLKFKDESRKTGPYLTYQDGRFYGRVKSSSKKQGDSGLLQYIEKSIQSAGYYDPDVVADRPTDDVS